MRTLLLVAVVLAGGCRKATTQPTGTAAPDLPPSWGTVVDPDNDCQFNVTGDTLTMTVQGRDKDLSIERNRMNAPRVLRRVSGDFVATVRVRGSMRASMFSAAFDRPSFVGAGLLLTADDKTYVRLERASLNQGGNESAYINWELRLNGQWTKPGNTGAARLADADTGLRLTRRGTVVRGEYTQDDGATWVPLEEITVQLPAEVWVGVDAVTTGVTSFRPSFDWFKVDGGQ